MSIQGNSRVSPEEMPATVQARGEGSVDVAPDAATVTVGVTATKPSLPAARDEAARQAETMIASVKEAGIPARDIQTSHYRIRVLRDTDPNGNPTIVRGYEVSTAIDVTVRDLELLPAVLDAATAAGANQVSGPHFFVQHPEEAEDEARRLAMASARHRAETLAAAEGATLGRVRSIVDAAAQRGPVPIYRQAAMADSERATPIERGMEQITAAVEVVWELA
jgi:uncharacterized protein